MSSDKQVQGAGFEPAKQYVLGPKPSAFDQAWQSLLIRGGSTIAFEA